MSLEHPNGSNHLQQHASSMTPEENIQAMIATMSRNGWRITDQRRAMVTIAAEHQGYMSPKDVYDQMVKFYPSVSFDTVYRNLRMMNEMGVLEQFYFMDGGLKFKANCQSHHHHHLICVNCEKTLSFDFCPMELDMGLPGGYKIQNHRFEIYGICEECQ